jgi:hypothetical protein
MRGDFILEITQQQICTIAVCAEDEEQAKELANKGLGNIECRFPIKLVTEKTKVIRQPSEI